MTDLEPTVGGAWLLPQIVEPWTLGDAVKRMKKMVVDRKVARRSRYIGWMCLLPEREVGAVFVDVITLRKFVQYVPDDAEPKIKVSPHRSGAVGSSRPDATRSGGRHAGTPAKGRQTRRRGLRLAPRRYSGPQR